MIEQYSDDQLQSLSLLLKVWEKIELLIGGTTNEKNAILDYLRESVIEQGMDLYDALFAKIMDGNNLLLSRGKFEVIDKTSLKILLNEIFINEDYYFTSDYESPLIVDCGVYTGLSLYYFKELFPHSRIIGFEPVPKFREIAEKNMANNNFSSVKILPFALSNQAGKAQFVMSSSDTMAGSLTNRTRFLGHEIEKIEVETVRLADYLQEPVNYLKIDVEGVEDVLLEDSAEYLFNVENIFIEYHHGAGLGSDRLLKILRVLELAGFDYRIGKSFGHINRNVERPIEQIGGRYSASIWAKNPNWGKKTKTQVTRTEDKIKILDADTIPEAFWAEYNNLQETISELLEKNRVSGEDRKKLLANNKELREIVQKQNEDNRKLRETNKELREIVQKQNEDNQKLRENNKELREIVQKQNENHQRLIDNYEVIKANNEKLRRENMDLNTIVQRLVRFDGLEEIVRMNQFYLFRKRSNGEGEQ